MKPILNTKPNSVQRTLIVTIGQLAQNVGDEFAELLKKRRGPKAAIAVVSVSTAKIDGECLTAVTEALTTISPPDLGAQLAIGGWRISHIDEIALILLMDVVSDGGALAVDKLQAITSVIYQHLGVEATSLLIWLVGDGGETAVSDCLLPHSPVTRGMIPMGLRNEAGLRLPDSDALTAICAELLWALTATPLRWLPEWVVEQPSHAHTHTSIMSVGVAGWAWSPTATHAAFVQRWLENVFSHWLATAKIEEADEAVATWMQANHFSQDTFADAVMEEEARTLPQPVFTSWHYPWPWHLYPLLTENLFLSESDIEACDQWHKKIYLQLDDSVQQATAVLVQHIESMLDQQPVAGISRAMVWLKKMIDVSDEQIGYSLDQADLQAETSSLLATHRGELQNRLDGWFASWPKSGWQAWIQTGLRPWRWPQIGWRYWQMHQTGQHLNHLLRQQAVQRRHHIVNAATRHIWAMLQKNVRHIHGQVEEIGEMLHHLAAESMTSSIKTDDDPQTRISNQPMVLANLPVPSSIYSQIVRDDEAEAVAAAVAIGGLGQHLQTLDDTMLMALTRFATERLAQVWQVTAVDALAATANDLDQLQQWWQAGTDAACPLWRPDETRLQEGERIQNGRFTLLCGANAILSPTLLDDDFLSAQTGQVYKVPTNDKERLLLLRIRTGLTAEAMVDI